MPEEKKKVYRIVGETSRGKEKKPEPKSIWRMGPEDLPTPKGVGYIQSRWDLCTGCGACEMACSQGHFGVMDREYSRIRIFRYFLPLPKSVQNVCAHCPRDERECQKACPLDPPAIFYDDKNFHMTVDVERCADSGCHYECMTGCPAEVPRGIPGQKGVMVCNLCERDGIRQPRCVDICPNYALEFLSPKFPQHLDRNHPDEKAKALARRLYPLKGDQIQRQPEEIWGGK
ncbi:MAG: 4Fe-4S binding protein [Dehalococcoidia bacterium]|nr:4Fe-4S binding protein [Dehalococcoidia bacterium]MDZ4247621.1 4Fe-4S binding protein [Dehalococcoidia bacterium]